MACGPGDAHVLRGLLESEGIRVVIRGDGFVPFQGGSLFGLETRPSVWVLEDETYPRARKIADEYAGKDGNARQPSEQVWTCHRCGEAIEAPFTACWNCGKERV